jgi:Domain of unknown function (DU1801)
MATNKTTQTTASVKDFLAAVKDDQRRKDCLTLVKTIREQTGMKPAMWGPAIVGFGSYHYRYDSGREGDAPLLAFSPRASTIAIYLCNGFRERETLLKKLGKHKSEGGCVNIKTLADINLDVLKQILERHMEHTRMLYPAK